MRTKTTRSTDERALKSMKWLFLSISLLSFFVFTNHSFADTTLYHIVSGNELSTLTVNNVYTPESIALEGYIHFSMLSLVLPIANDVYKNREVLFLLHVTFSDDDERLKWIGDNPDFHQGLDLSVVEEKIQFIRDPNNDWSLPNEYYMR